MGAVIYPPPATIMNFAFGTKMLKFSTPHDKELEHVNVRSDFLLLRRVCELMKRQTSFNVLLSQLGAENTVAIVSALLHEQKVRRQYPSKRR